MLVDVARAGLVMEIQRARKLPLPGEVLVNVGEQVHSTDVIAKASLTGKISLVDVATGLGVDPSNVKDVMVRQVGEKLTKGDMIAQISGAIPRVVRAPQDGRLAAFHQGKAVFEVETEVLELQAGMDAVVLAVIPEFGAILSTSGLLIQGLWGNGRIGSGQLHIALESWTHPLEDTGFDDMAGQIIAVGMCNREDVFMGLIEKEPAGLIFGTLGPKLIKTARTLPMPLIVVQGFGPIPADKSILEWLQPLAGRTACLNASETDRIAGLRPEVIIPCEVSGEAESLGMRLELREGHKVRVYSGQALGEVGEVTALPDGWNLFESGLQLPAVNVALESGEEIIVPQQNVVVIG